MKKPRLRKAAGWVLVSVGFVALVTPLTPGGLLFFVGLELLGLRVLVNERFRRFLPGKKALEPVVVTENTENVR